MRGSLPAESAPRLEPRDLAERRFLEQVTRLQVRGEALGLPDLLRSAWDRLKLVEALWAQDRVQSPPVDVVKLGRSRAMRAQFNGFARVVSQEAKTREGAYTQPPEPKPARANAVSPRPSSGPKVSAAEEVQESAFMKKLRVRAQELARQSQQREQEQDPD